MIDFAIFFAAAHAEQGTDGPPPYPWQSRLAHRLATATAPRAIVVPTGCGKTATIDALIWALAMQADRSAVLRTVGVRTVWAIDRRILVDEVHDHVARLAERLADAAVESGDVLHDVARALQSLTGDGSPPLVATRWRGGAEIDRAARHPFQPEVITSTVAQVGSRLLFRGYGVGRRSLPVQAGLTAVDTTICLDEAHIAEPFRATVEAIRAHRARERLTLPALNMITLTATPNAPLPPEEIATITRADRPMLGPRLTGSKTARLVEPASAREADVRTALLEAVQAHLTDGAGCVACIVNSVKVAIEVFRAAAGRLPDAEHAILIGPQRPADRAALVERHRAALFERGRPRTPLVLVATQTFEVGLDADVEALVTQSASAAALVQRLGRLNRAGTRTGRATIVRDAESWLYADEEALAWEWLRSLRRQDGTIDVSVDGLASADGRPEPASVVPAPALTSDVLDRLVQTAPRPAMMDDPDVDVFLRGARSEPSADVLVAWRCDLGDVGNPEELAFRKALLRLAPPGPQECVTLGIGRARALLAALGVGSKARSRFAAGILDEPDLEGARGESVLPRIERAGRVDYVVLRGGEHLESVALQPGDVIVLPARAGGYAQATVDHSSTAPVQDVGPDLLAARGAPAAGVPPYWRLNGEVLDALDETSRRAVMQAADGAVRADPASEDRSHGAASVAALLVAAYGRDPAKLGLEPDADLEIRATTELTDPFARGLQGEPPNPQPDHETAGDADGKLQTDRSCFVLVRRRTVASDQLRPRGSRPPTLDAHAVAVRARIEAYLHGAELPPRIAATLVLAARAHDHGKTDPRMQAFFRGGHGALGGAALAKSEFGSADLSADRAARAAAGMPRDLRHEVESVAILRDALATGRVDELPDDFDRELLLHLVGTHHGLGRPIARAPRGGAAPRRYQATAAGISGAAAGDGLEAWAEGAWLQRFLTVNEHLGAWGSAYVGALLVLADRTVSAEGA